MGPNLLQALYDSLNAGKAGVKAAFAPKLGGPDAESAFKSALAGGVGAAMVPFGALDEAATGAGQYMAEDVGRAGAAVERAGMPTLGKALGVGGAALGMVPVAGSFAVDPEAGAAKVAGRSVLEHLAAQNLPEAVMRKAESLQAMYGEDALAKIVKEYADKGVPLFSHDLPMDEASRMARGKEIGFDLGEKYHGGPNKFTEFREGRVPAYFTDSPEIANIYANAINRHKGIMEINAGPNVGKYFLSGKELKISDLGPDKTHGWSKDNMLAALGLPEDTPRFPTKDISKYGYDRKTITEMADLGGEQTQYLAPFSKNIRSQFAAFDPRMKDSRFLLALKAGAIPLAGLGAAASLEGQ